MAPAVAHCRVFFRFAGNVAQIDFPLARADAYILRTLPDPRDLLVEELARYNIAPGCVTEIVVHRGQSSIWRWTAPGAHAPEQGEPRDLTLIPPAPEAPGREARAGTRLGVEPERDPSSRQALADCPCGDHERSRACCTWACSDLHIPAERAAAFLAETERVAASARKPLPPPPRSVDGPTPDATHEFVRVAGLPGLRFEKSATSAGAGMLWLRPAFVALRAKASDVSPWTDKAPPAQRSEVRAPSVQPPWIASWVLPCDLDVPKLTYHMHRHVRHGYQVITLHTFEATGMGSLYHCGRLARTGRVAELVEYADTIADQETS